MESEFLPVHTSVATVRLFAPEIFSLFTNNVGAKSYVLNQKALQCLKPQELAPVDAILCLDHQLAARADLWPKLSVLDEAGLQEQTL